MDGCHGRLVRPCRTDVGSGRRAAAGTLWVRQTRPLDGRRRGRRKGSLTLEVVLVLPILLLTLVAGIQFGTTMIVEQAVTHAATVGAREAGKGADVDQVVSAVETMLVPHGIHIGPYAGVVLEDLEASPPVQQRGLPACAPPSTPTLNSTQVRVTVCVDLSSKPFLNAMRFIGVDSRGKRFSVSAVVGKEGLDTPIVIEQAQCDCD